MDNFDGFPKDALAFLTEVADNNNKAWFDANKPRFKSQVQAPSQAMVVALGEQLDAVIPNIRYDTKLTGSGSIMRIYRDTRFSKDKTPYKTNVGIVWWQGEGKKLVNPGFYFHLSPGDTWMGGGLYHFPDLDRFRVAVHDDVMGSELEAALAEMAQVGVTPTGDRYKRVPRGYDADHPRAELLKLKGLVCSSGQISPEVVNSAELINVCFDFCMKMMPLHKWLVKMMTTEVV